MQYGKCLSRILHHVHFLHLSHPDKPIVVAKTDMDAAYRRVHPVWSLAVQCISIIGSLAYLLLRLPFGAAAAPAEFCVMSEAICDTANDLLHDPTWDPTATPTAYDAILPPADILPMTTPFAKALPLDVQPPDVLSPAKCDVYIADIITVGLYLRFLTLRLLMAAAVAIYAIFRPLQTSESSIGDHPLSIRKLAGDGALAETKIILGWLLNTRLFTLSLPHDKFLAWVSEIHEMLANGFTTEAGLPTLTWRVAPWSAGGVGPNPTLAAGAAAPFAIICAGCDCSYLLLLYLLRAVESIEEKYLKR